MSAIPIGGTGTHTSGTLVVSCSLGSAMQVFLRSTVPDLSMVGAFFNTGSGITGGSPSAEIMDTSTGVVVTSSTITADTTPPNLQSFVEFDLDYGSLTFSFSEAVNVSSLDFTKLTLQNDFAVTAGNPSYMLTGGVCDSTCNCTSGTVITFCINEQDLNAIKLMTGLCTGESNCVPNYEAGFISDLSDPSVTPSTTREIAAYDPAATSTLAMHQLVSGGFVSDTSSPTLTSFDIDLSDDTLTLTFSEPVDVSSFTPTGLTLQSMSTGGTTLTLTSATTTSSPDGAVITLALEGDADLLKLETFATSSDNTFLSVSSTAFIDVYGNAITAINSTSAIQVNNYTDDTTGPEIASFTLDLDSNSLLITFSEPVINSTIEIANFSLTNNDSISLDLQSGTLQATGLTADGRILTISIQLDGESLTSLKTNDTIGTALTDTFVSVESDSFADVYTFTNPSQVIAASSIVPDNTPAVLSRYSIDMNIGVLTLTFTDVIDSSSYRTDRIEIQKMLSEENLSPNQE